jgi:hypothetical protein
MVDVAGNALQLGIGGYESCGSSYRSLSLLITMKLSNLRICEPTLLAVDAFPFEVAQRLPPFDRVHSMLLMSWRNVRTFRSRGRRRRRRQQAQIRLWA